MSAKMFESRVDLAIALTITLGTVAVGIWVADTYVGFKPPPDYCPDSEYTCTTSFNFRNLDAYAVGIGTATTLFIPTVVL